MLFGLFCWCDGVGSWVCVVSEATILLGHTYRGTSQLPTCLPLLCLVLLTSLWDKNPPSTHSFSLPVMSAFHFLFISIHVVYYGFYEATIMTSTITEEER